MKTEFQLEIVNKLKKLRVKHHLTQMDVSIILSLDSPGQIGNIESSKFNHKYTLKQIKKLCDYYHYPIHKLFFDEEITNCEELILNTFDRIIEYEN